jgi:NitT/TauT family transport system substrate-binding protein
MIRISRRSVLAGAAAATLSHPRSSFGQAVPARVRFAVDFVWQSNHAIWTIAQYKAFFSDDKLNVSVDRGYGSSDNLTKLAAGALDIGLVDPNLLGKFNQENPGSQMTAVFVVYDAAPSAAVYLKSSGIKAMKDIEGRKVAVTDGSANVPLFKALCQLNGVDASKIEFLSVSPALRDTMVIQKRADIAVGFFTTSVINMMAAGIPKDDIGYFQYSRLGLALYSLCLVCKKDYCAANPETVAAFIRGTVKGTREMLADPKGAVASIMRRDGLLKENVEFDRNELMNDGCLVTPWVRQHGLSVVDRERFESTTGQVTELLGGRRPKMEDIYTDKLLPPQSERKVV